MISVHRRTHLMSQSHPFLNQALDLRRLAGMLLSDTLKHCNFLCHQNARRPLAAGRQLLLRYIGADAGARG